MEKFLNINLAGTITPIRIDSVATVACPTPAADAITVVTITYTGGGQVVLRTAVPTATTGTIETAAQAATLVRGFWEQIVAGAGTPWNMPVIPGMGRAWDQTVSPATPQAATGVALSAKSSIEITGRELAAGGTALMPLVFVSALTV
tara:strand:+ start:106 stop:546 length:441 start_codon:yes stop_codon:yes gene_type:complete